MTMPILTLPPSPLLSLSLRISPTRRSLSKPKEGEEVHAYIDRGKLLIVRMLAVGALSETGQREVYFELNSEPRSLVVDDRTASNDTVRREKASNDPGSVGSPLAGVCVEVRVQEGGTVKAGDPIVVMSAMKMDTVVSAPVSGKVERILVKNNDSVSQGDLLCEIKHE
jgi:pyruvate carboxylase